MQHHLHDHFRCSRQDAEAIPINIEMTDDLVDKNSFCMLEFDAALSSRNDSARVTIPSHLLVVQKLVSLAKSYLLQFCDHLWVHGLLLDSC